MNLVMNTFTSVSVWIKVIHELLGLIFELPKLRRSEVSWH